MKKFLFDCGTRDATASVGLLGLRVTTGMMMLFGHGIPKIQQFAALKTKFPVPDFFPFQFMSPTVSLSACIAAEVVCAFMLVIGMATRHAAFILGFNMVVAAFAVLAAAPWFMGPGIPAAKEPALLYLIPMLVLILTGAGSFSVDAQLHKETKRRRW